MSAQPERAAALPRSPAVGAESLRSRVWLAFCRGVVRVFYRQVEVIGAERIPATGAAILCANHHNAFADVAVLQSATPRILHPLARSGLFENPLMRPVLRFLNAVPVYRVVDRSDTSRNVDSFARCYELLTEGGMLVLFPEGVSHSEPQLQPLKTGAARIALGAKLSHDVVVSLVPAGLTWVEKGRFRSRVLLQIGEPLDLGEELEELGDSPGADPTVPPADLVRSLTARLDAAIRSLTLNLDSWQDLQLVRQLERFFHFRGGRHPGSVPLGERFRTFQRLIQNYERLRLAAQPQLARLRRELLWFDRLRRLWGIDEYHIRQSYRPASVARWILRNLLFLLPAAPISLWALVTSGLPYLLVAFLTPRVSRRYDQYDTNKILLGLFFYGLFWGAEAALVVWRFGWLPGLLFALSLPLAAGVGLALLHRRDRIREQVRAFLLFRRRRDLRPYLLERRREIERHVAELARLARRLPRGRDAVVEGSNPPLESPHDLG